MDNEERQIEMWMDVAAEVFAAEDRISLKWFPELRKAKDLPSGERRRLAEEYLRAIATDIVAGIERYDEDIVS